MRLILTLSLSLNLVLLAVACTTGTLPHWDGEFWAGDATAQSVRRSQDNPPREIKASDPEFSKGVWMSYQSLSCLYQQLILNCAKWVEANPICKPIPDAIVEQLSTGVRK